MRSPLLLKFDFDFKSSESQAAFTGELKPKRQPVHSEYTTKANFCIAYPYNFADLNSKITHHLN